MGLCWHVERQWLFDWFFTGLKQQRVRRVNTNANMYPQSIGDVMQPTLSANSPQNSGNTNDSGQVFMGVSSPQPWKWTVMNEEK